MEASGRDSEKRQPSDHPELAQSKGGILRRSTIVALIFGSALMWINQSAAIIGWPNSKCATPVAAQSFERRSDCIRFE